MEATVVKHLRLVYLVQPRHESIVAAQLVPGFIHESPGVDRLIVPDVSPPKALASLRAEGNVQRRNAAEGPKVVGDGMARVPGSKMQLEPGTHRRVQRRVVAAV